LLRDQQETYKFGV